MALAEPLRISDGIISSEGGVDGGLDPHLIGRNQLAWAENVTLRGGSATTRPGYRQLVINGEYTAAVRKPFQGVEFFEDTGARGYLIIAAGGLMYRVAISSTRGTFVDISIPSDPNNDQAPIVYMKQADRFLVAQDGSSTPFIYDGANSRRAEADEVPIGTGPMAYGLGRLWVASGREFTAGDVLGGPTGVLKFTENTYLAEGGSFTVPLQSGPITAMAFTASPNTALGQGELLVSTTNSVYSVVAPIDRTLWKNLSDPIQRIVLINTGSLSHYSTVLVNGDVFIRSLDGIRSVIQAVRDFSQLGNVPISREMSRTLDGDNPELLKFTSGILFDNRLLMTTRAQAKHNGSMFRGLAVLDFDLISSMGKRLPPTWDGLWTGLDILRVVKGRFNGVERAFSIVRNPNKRFISSAIVKTGFAVSSGQTLSITIQAGGGSGATGVAYSKINSAIVFAGGTGYVAGDIVSISGGTFTKQSVLLVTTVSAGVVTGLSFVSNGRYSSLPSPISATTGGTGTGLQVSLAATVNEVSITAGGSFTGTPDIRLFVNDVLQLSFVAVPFMDYEWEIWEISRKEKFDYPLNSSNVHTERRIPCLVETPSLNFEGNRGVNRRDQKKLIGAEIWLDKIFGTLDCSIEFRPDQYPCWQAWHAWQHCTLYKDCGPSIDCQPKTYIQQNRPRIGIPIPPDVCDLATQRNLNYGREFQARLSWEGYTQLKLLEVVAYATAEQTHPDCAPAVEACTGLLACPCD